MIHLLDQRFPGRTWVVGVLEPERLEPALRTRLQRPAAPSVASVRDTWLGRLPASRIAYDLSLADVESNVDALVVLSASPLRAQASAPLDPSYERELRRRRALHDATLPFRGAKIRFREGLAALEATAVEPLGAVLAELRRDAALRLLVKAFADGSEPDADGLSQRRARLVVDWLAARGVQSERLRASGCGARRPMTFGDTARDRAVNRRAELVRLTPTAGCEPPW